METTAVLGLACMSFFILALVVYLIKEFGCNKNETSLDLSGSQDLEKGIVNISLKEPDNEYSQIPALVKPLRPPRAVEKVGSISLIDLTDEEKDEILMFKIRSVQDSLKLTTNTVLKCNMIISVDANANGIGAYCVDLQNRKCEIYTYKLVCLPWEVKDANDFVEVGMKNLLFALMLWEDEIRASKSLRIYMANNALNLHPDNPYVLKVSKILNHYQHCEKIIVSNPGDMCMEIKNNEAPDGTSIGEEYFANFVRFVQPAVDLAYWRVKLSEKYLSNFYGIENHAITKTHCQMKWNKAECRPWYETTYAYSDFLEEVRVSRKRWETPCSKCGCQDIG